MAKEKLITDVWIDDNISIRKDNDGFYSAIFNDVDSYYSNRFSINELSIISRRLSLMVFEHFNPDHHDIKPCGFTK